MAGKSPKAPRHSRSFSPRYDDPSPSPPWYDFAITSFAHSVHFYAQCGSSVVDNRGIVLVDPDGYIFDVTQGFTPTLHPVAGVTVTCMVSMTQWGGWVPWPAHLYNNQVNPQVTREDGYFAFVTPPGYYYLQVGGKNGHQPWRSPVIEDITQIVHLPLYDTRAWDGGMMAPGRVYRREFAQVGTYSYADGLGHEGQCLEQRPNSTVEMRNGRRVFRQDQAGR
ncbi:MAG: hypothetical protein ACP5SI_03425 [Chloroflexia bacterium]